MSDIIQADPKLLNSSAEKVGAIHAVLSTNIETAKSKINSLKGTWTGPAATAFQSSFVTLHGKCAEALRTVANMKVALQNSASEFQTGEATVKKAAESLPSLKGNLK